MNHITQIMNTKLSNKSTPPASNEICPPSQNTPVRSGCWSSKIISMVKDCRDAIREKITIDKTPRGNEVTRTFGSQNRKNNRTNSLCATTPSKTPGTPAKKSTNAAQSGSLKSNKSDVCYEQHKISASVGKIFLRGHSKDSMEYWTDNETNSSLDSFRALERQVQEECLQTPKLQCTVHRTYYNERKNYPLNVTDDDAIMSPDIQSKKGRLLATKTKFSPASMVAYNKDANELYWLEDLEDLDDYLPGKAGSTLKQTNVPKSTSQEPYQNFTFSENSITDKQTSSPISPARVDSECETLQNADGKDVHRVKHNSQLLDDSDDEVIASQDAQNISNANNEVPPVKRKISTEPFLTKNEHELFWVDDLDDSFPFKLGNSLKQTNVQEITFQEPCQNSTFCENLMSDKLAPSPVHPALADSGYENN